MSWEYWGTKVKHPVGGFAVVFCKPMGKKELDIISEHIKLILHESITRIIPLQMSGERLIEWAKHENERSSRDMEIIGETLEQKESGR